MKITYEQEQKERLDKFLQTKLTISRSQIKKIILAGQVKVNDQLSSVHHWLRKNDQIVYKQPEDIKKPKNNFSAIKILAKTSDYLVIEKPTGLLVHPTAKGETNTLADWLVKKFPSIAKVGDDPQRPGIVHRLDKEVSGLMVIALTQDSFENLKKQFQARTTKKEYTLLVHGQVSNVSGEISTSLERDKKSGLMKTQPDTETSKTALTTYRVIKRLINYTLLKTQIKTGRMHQIRTHFYSIGHSIVGDKLYQTKDIRKKKKVLDSRIFLHASLLKFKDLRGVWQKYESPLPQELKELLTTLK
jgi:23S rRNA pseudouridine1911/1915/1917 synthase